MAGTMPCHFFIPAILEGTLPNAMDKPLPRVTGPALHVVETLVRRTPLPRVWSRLIMRHLSVIDFAAAGDPPPYYCPPAYRK
jgi:hypothetical protein